MSQIYGPRGGMLPIPDPAMGSPAKSNKQILNSGFTNHALNETARLDGALATNRGSISSAIDKDGRERPYVSREDQRELAEVECHDRTRFVAYFGRTPAPSQ
jgi:hypothetical protein